MSGSNDQQQQPQPPVDQNALLQLLIRQQLAAASGQTPQVQLPSLPAPPAQTQYSNDPSKGPDLLERIGLALGGGSLPGAPAELRAQMGRQGLLNFGIGLMSAGKFATPGEVLAGGLRGAQQGLLGTEGMMAGQQEYALNAQGKLLGLGIEQQKARTDALTALVPLLQMQGRLGLPPLFGGGAGGPPGGGPGSNVPDVARDTSYETAGEQANNPGNLMTTSAPGQTGVITLPGDRKLAVFPNVATGVAANAANLANYQTQYGINTVQDAVKRWVGDPKADLTAYTNAIAKALGVSPTDKIDLTNPAVQRAFIIAQQPFETGGKKQWLNPADVDAGIVLAQKLRQAGPGGGPAPASVGPYKPPGATTAAAGPPGVQMGGEPPAPPGAPANAPAAGGGIGLALNPPTGREQATVAPPPVVHQAPIPGKRASAADIIQSGMQLAADQRTPPGTVLAAGPAAGTPPAASAAAAPEPTPEAGWGAKVGSYNNAPVGPITTPPPAAQPPAPPAAQPPAAQPQPPAAQPAQPPATTEYPGDVQATPEQYMREHYQAATPEEVARYAPGPTGEAARNAAQKVQDAQQQLTAARTQLDQIRRGAMPGDPNKAMSDVQAAQNELDKNRSAYDEEVQKLAQAGAGNLLTRDNAEKTRVSGNYQKVQDRQQQNEQQAQTLANNIRLKEIEGEQQRITNREAVGNKVNQDTLTQAVKDQIDARNLATSIEGFQTMTANVGQPGWLQTTKNPFGQGETIAEKLGQMGVPVSDTGGIQAMQAGINEMIKSLRAGMPMGSLSDRDLDFIRRMGPTEWMDPDTRMAVTSYIMQAARAKQQFSYEIQKNLSKPGANAADAIEAADRKVKSFVPQVPFSSSQWSDRSAEGTAKRMQWLQDHPLPPGTLYHLNDGSVMISKRPGSQPPSRPQSGPAVGYGNQ